jgi:DNA-binding NarL/FixJ family response regulator/predicted ATPase
MSKVLAGEELNVAKPQRGALCASLGSELARGRTTVLTGPPGIGKTSMLRAIVGHPDVRRQPIRHAAASVTAQRFPFGAFAGLVRFDSRSNDTTMMSQLIDEFRNAPTKSIVVVDDAHVLDDHSASLLHHLVVENLATVLTAVRSDSTVPDAVRHLIHDSLAEIVPIPALTDEEIVSFAEAELNGVIDRSTARLIIMSSEGNPLIVRELLSATRAVGLLRKIGNTWSASRLVPGSSARELVRDRINSLDPGLLEVGKVFAVGGRLPLRIANAAVGAEKLLQARANGLITSHGDRDLYDLVHPLFAETIRADVAPAEVIAITSALLDLSEHEPVNTEDLVIRRCLWALELSDHRQADPNVLLTAADSLFNTARFEPAIRIAETVLRTTGSERAQKMLQRFRGVMGTNRSALPNNFSGINLPLGSSTNGATDTGLGQGAAVIGASKELAGETSNGATTSAATLEERYQTSIGRAEGFILGIIPLEGLLDELEQIRLELASNGDSRSEAAEAHWHGTTMRIGANPLTHVVRLRELFETSSNQLALITALQTLSTIMSESGRGEEWIAMSYLREYDEYTGNIFHRVNLGMSRALAQLWLGNTKEVSVVLRRDIATGAGADSDLTKVFTSAPEAELALAQGRPLEALRSLGVIASMVGELDSAGLFSWATAASQWASAWNGEAVTIADVPPLIPLYGRNLTDQIELLNCRTLEAQGNLRRAKERALALADRTETTGRFAIAVGALHLACGIEPTLDLAARAQLLASRCQGVLASTQARYCDALACDDEAALLLAAEQFESAGYLAFALEAAHRCTEAARRNGHRASALRGSEMSSRLKAAGVTPTFSMRFSGTPERLTAREMEIAVMAARGASNRDVSESLSLSRRTVETHLQRIYRKIGVNDRTSLSEFLASA